MVASRVQASNSPVATGTGVEVAAPACELPGAGAAATMAAATELAAPGGKSPIARPLAAVAAIACGCRRAGMRRPGPAISRACFRLRGRTTDAPPPAPAAAAVAGLSAAFRSRAAAIASRTHCGVASACLTSSPSSPASASRAWERQEARGGMATLWTCSQGALPARGWRCTGAETGLAARTMDCRGVGPVLPVPVPVDRPVEGIAAGAGPAPAPAAVVASCVCEMPALRPSSAIATPIIPPAAAASAPTDPSPPPLALAA